MEKEGFRLKPEEWNCGDQIKIIDAVAPFGSGEKVVAEVRRAVEGG